MWSVLPETARRARHILHVAVRNLEISGEIHPIDCAFSISDGDGERFRSEILYSTLNPTWESPQMSRNAGILREFKLTIWRIGRDGEEEQSLQVEVNLSNLKRHPKSTLSMLEDLPANSIFFLVHDGIYYIPGAISTQTVPEEKVVAASFKKIQLKVMLEKVLELYRVKKAQKEIQESSLKVCEQIEKKVNDLRGSHLEFCKNSYKHRQLSSLNQVSLLPNQKAQEALDGKREVKNSRIQEAKEIMEVTIMLKKVKALVDRFQKEFSEGTLQLNDTFQKLELRKRKIIQILREIYPISTSFDDPNAFAIRGISGNAKLDDDENMSSVLSYISHLLIMLAKYLRVHLRFRINYHASRSSISDEVSRNSSNYPLYGKGFDRLAETWMTRDILLLLERRGIPSGLKIEGISGMLSQLNKLFETECP